jgi:hypothetical protein
VSQEAVERVLMEWLLAGDHPALAILRAQHAVAEMAERELSGVGSFTHFRVPTDAPALPGGAHAVVDDVAFDLEGRETGGGAILFVRDGVLDMLELVMLTEPWPDVPRLRGVVYMRDGPHGDWRGYDLEPGAGRDAAVLAEMLG